MDYDENDFQSQNLQLAGEGNSKFPPVLRPYALPKFEFDDNLHGSLRFDRLVETEAFLGIESNEDNQWIEDYSRGGSGIQFSSSAVEPCSISRNNNVWSEATSLESVEMLLKSVGQEEIIPLQTSNKVSDSCDDLGCIIKQMEPNLRVNSSASSTERDAMQSAQVLGNIPQDNSGFDIVDGGQQLDIEGSSHDLKTEEVSGKDLSNIGDAIVNPILPAEKGSGLIDDDCGKASNRKVGLVLRESLDAVDHIISTSGLAVDGVVSSAQNVSPENENLDDDSASILVSVSAATDCDDKINILNHESQITDNSISGVEVVEAASVSHSCLLESESKVEANVIKANFATEEDLHCTLQKDDSGITEPLGMDKSNAILQNVLEETDMVGNITHEKVEICNPSDPQLVGITEPLGMDKSNAIMPNVLEETDMEGNITHEKDEICNPSDPRLVGITEPLGMDKSKVIINVLEKDMVGNITHEKDEICNPSDPQLVSEHLSSQDAASLWALELKDGAKGILNEHCEKSTDDSSTEENIAAEVLSEKQSETEVLSCVAPELEVSGKSITPSQDDTLKLDKDTPCKEMATRNLGCDQVNTDCQLPAFISAEGGGSLSPSGKHSLEVEPMPAELNPKAAGEVEPVDSPPATSSSRNDVQDSMDRRVVDLPESLALGSVHLDKSKDTPAKTPIETSPLDIRSSFQLEAGDNGFSGISGKMQHELPDQSLATSGGCNVESSDAPLAVILIESEQRLTKESDMSAESEQGNLNEILTENDGKSPIMEPDLCKKEMHEPQASAIQESCHNTGGNSRKNDKTVAVSGDAGLHNPTTTSSGEKADLVMAVSVLPSDSGTSEHPNTEAEKVRIKGFSDIVSLTHLKNEGAGKDEGNPKDLNKLDAPKDAKNFTSQSQDGKQTHSSTEQATTPTVGKSPSTSAWGQSDQKTAQKPSPGSVRVSEVTASRGRSKGNSERKPRRSSTKVTGKEAARKPNSVKDSALGQTEKGETTSIITLNPSATSQILQPAAEFQQSFMDMQQVQLRAQIFVYGALIQGTPPDEAHMVSAFGGPDGGRSIWDKAWRSCMERLRGPKLYPNTPETPLPSSFRASDPATKQGVLDIKGTSTAGQTNIKSTPMFLSPMVPFSSPLWSMNSPSAEILQPSSLPRGPVVDFQRAASPLHHQTTPIRNFVGHNASWISQPPFCGPWVASPQSSVQVASARSSIPKHSTKPVQPTPAKDSSLHHPSASKHITPGPAAQIVFSSGVFVAPTIEDANTVSDSSGRPAAEMKSRKRKKASLTETSGLHIKFSQPQTDSIPIPSQAQCTVSMSPAIGFVSEADAEKSIAFLSSTPFTDLRNVNQDAERRNILPEEALAKVKEARVQAEEATALAAAAVSHSQDMWNQLDKLKSSGLLPDVEARLASAAGAIAAAATVAKAAAAAANVASNAALQAKLMADEAVGSYSNATQATVISLSDGEKNLGKATPVSILKGDDGANSSNAILGAARETARRRVEATSAASKQAENIDAIVRAAELAAEAVSQAGKIVAMGDPLPLSELVAAGPDGYWKVTKVTSELVCKSNDTASEIVKMDNKGDAVASAKFLKDASSNKKETRITRHGNPPDSKEISSEENLKLIDVLSGTGAAGAKESKGRKVREPSNSAKTRSVVPESEMVSRTPINDPGVHKKTVEAAKQQSAIKEGSHVEVFKDSAGLKTAWFCADVISLDGGKAHVCYNDLMAGEGTEKLKEWVELFPEGDKAPSVRITRPVTALPFEGTRKRRRAAMGDCRWSVGDKVDAWISDSWREGIITEKNMKEDTILTVHFPVHGETVTAKAWHLRSSLVWKDGEWIECACLGENSQYPHEGDTPGEKRPRILSPAVETTKNDKSFKGVDAMESDKPAEPTLLDLTADEKIFQLGKSIKDNKPGTLRMTRTGLQKEGSKIFGVPKPGKKRKFMEVSKHYVADRSSKSNSANDSFKSAKYLMPQGSSRGLRNSSRPAPNEKAAVLPKSKLGKPQTAFGRTIPQKDHLSHTAASAMDEKTRDSASLSEITSKHNHVESFKEATEGPMSFSSHAPLSTDTLVSKNTSSSRSKLERDSKGRLAPARGRLGKIEEDKAHGEDSAHSTTGDVEPRRSNRRIQPTSRLLEGLQSSLTVPKLPIISQDKGQRSRSNFKRD